MLSAWREEFYPFFQEKENTGNFPNKLVAPTFTSQ